MTLRKRCKICGNLIGKIHNCSGFKETVLCPKCGRKILKTSLLTHLKRKCPTQKEKTLICGCGEEIFRGHGHESRHIKTCRHIRWENKDRKLRKLGVKKDSSGRYCAADPELENVDDPNYYRSVAFGNHIKTCHLLDKINNAYTGKDTIFCYCGINCSESNYGKHCISEYHKKWVKDAIQFYSKLSNTRKINADKKRAYRRRRKIRTEFYKKLAEKNLAKSGALEESKINMNDPDNKFSDLLQENSENNDDSKEYQKKALNVLKSLKCTGNLVFYRGNEIQEIISKIEKTKYFLLKIN